MNSDFEPIFVRLRGILQKHSAAFTVTADAPDHYCLQIVYSPKLKKSFPVAWVKIGKAYVGYHFMAVYMFRRLLEGRSDKLKARTQGKSCINFKVMDEALFKELEALTTEGFASCSRERFRP